MEEEGEGIEGEVRRDKKKRRWGGRERRRIKVDRSGKLLAGRRMTSPRREREGRKRGEARSCSGN